MGQCKHSSWMTTLDSGWSSVSRRTLACQYGSREEFAIMLDRQSSPMEKSSPAFVFMPLWHATQRSEVRNSGVDDGFLLPPRTRVTEATNNVRTAMEPRRVFCITSPQSTFRRPNPKGC